MKRAENTLAQTMGLKRVRKESENPAETRKSIISTKRREEKQVGDIMKSKYFPIVFSFALCKFVHAFLVVHSSWILARTSFQAMGRMMGGYVQTNLQKEKHLPYLRPNTNNSENLTKSKTLCLIQNKASKFGK